MFNYQLATGGKVHAPSADTWHTLCRRVIGENATKLLRAVDCAACQRHMSAESLAANDTGEIQKAYYASQSEAPSRQRLVTVAPVGMLCGWGKYGETGALLMCGSDNGKPGVAVHVLTRSLPVAVEGTALCALHSPYDVTPEDREAIRVPVPHTCVQPYVTGCVACELAAPIPCREVGCVYRTDDLGVLGRHMTDEHTPEPSADERLIFESFDTWGLDDFACSRACIDAMLTREVADFARDQVKRDNVRAVARVPLMMEKGQRVIYFDHCCTCRKPLPREGENGETVLPSPDAYPFCDDCDAPASPGQSWCVRCGSIIRYVTPGDVATLPTVADYAAILADIRRPLNKHGKRTRFMLRRGQGVRRPQSVKVHR